MLRISVQDEKIVFILDESNVLESGFLERMNTLLANGEVCCVYVHVHLHVCTHMHACMQHAWYLGPSLPEVILPLIAHATAFHTLVVQCSHLCTCKSFFCACMCMYMYVCVCVYVHVCMFVCLFVCLHVRLHVCMCSFFPPLLMRELYVCVHVRTYMQVPGLFEGDEFTTLLTQCKEGSQREGLMLDSAEELYKWFTEQVTLIPTYVRVGATVSVLPLLATE